MISKSYSQFVCQDAAPDPAKGGTRLGLPHFIGLAVVIMGLLALPVLEGLRRLWYSDQNLEGLLLVPILCAVIFYKSRGDFALSTPKPVKWLLYLLPAALVAMFVASKYDFPRVAGLLLVVNLLIASLGILGYANSKLFVGPFLFLMLMVPLPQLAVDFVIVNLQRLFSAIIEMVLFSFSDTFLVRHGFEFWFASINYPLVIAPECSGIRSLLGFVIIASFLAVFDRHSIATTILMITTGVVITLVLNILRILVTTQLRLCDLEEYSVGGWHGLLGIAVFTVGCVVLYMFSMFLKSLTSKVGEEGR